MLKAPLLVTLGLLGLICGCQPTTYTGQGGYSDTVEVPKALHDGTASLAEATAWVKSQDSGTWDLISGELPLCPGGPKATFLSPGMWAGSGGRTFMVFIPGPAGYRYVGALSFFTYRPLPPDSRGRSRVVTWWRTGCDGYLSLSVLSERGFEEVKNKYVYEGDQSTEEQREQKRALCTFFDWPEYYVNDPFKPAKDRVISEADIQKAFAIESKCPEWPVWFPERR